MRSNDETLADNRTEVVGDLRRVFRRANSEIPVMNPEDLAIMRNIVHPALNLDFGKNAQLYFRTSPILQLGFLKEAGAWDSFTGGLSDIGSGLWGGVSNIANAVYDVPGALYGAGKALISPGPEGRLAGFGRELSEPFRHLGVGGADILEGLGGAAGKWTGQSGTDWWRKASKGWQDYGRPVSEIALPMLIPGMGLVGGGIRSTLGALPGAFRAAAAAPAVGSIARAAGLAGAATLGTTSLAGGLAQLPSALSSLGGGIRNAANEQIANATDIPADMVELSRGLDPETAGVFLTLSRDPRFQQMVQTVRESSNQLGQDLPDMDRLVEAARSVQSGQAPTGKM